MYRYDNVHYSLSPLLFEVMVLSRVRMRPDSETSMLSLQNPASLEVAHASWHSQGSIWSVAVWEEVSKKLSSRPLGTMKEEIV